MGYEWVAGLIVLLAVGVLFLGGLVLSRPGWILGWLRGNSGILLFVAAASIGVFAINIFNYQVHNPELPIVTLSISTLR